MLLHHQKYVCESSRPTGTGPGAAAALGRCHPRFRALRPIHLGVGVVLDWIFDMHGPATTGLV